MKNGTVTKKGIAVWLDGCTEFALYALVFVLPFSKSLLEIFFTIACVFWVVRRWITRPVRVAGPRGEGLLKAFQPVETGINLPIYALVFFGFLSTLTSVSLQLSLRGFCSKLLEGVMLCFITAETINNAEKVRRFMIVLLASMALLCADGVFQYIYGVDFIRHHLLNTQRITGSFDAPNGFAAWLTVMIPLALSLAYFWKADDRTGLEKGRSRFRHLIKPAAWVLTIMLVGCMMFTYTRGGWLAALLAVVFLGLKKSKRLLIATVIVVSIMAFTANGEVRRRATVIFYPSPYDEGVKNARLDLWREAVSIIKDFPFLGCGLNTYARVVPLYKKEVYTGYYPHNCYLQMAAESGILGLGAFIWVIGALYKKTLASLTKIGDGWEGAFLAGTLAGLFGLLVHSLIDVDLYTLQLGNLMWFLIGLIVAVRKVAESRGGRSGNFDAG